MQLQNFFMFKSKRSIRQSLYPHFNFAKTWFYLSDKLHAKILQKKGLNNKDSENFGLQTLNVNTLQLILQNQITQYKQLTQLEEQK